LAAQSLRSSSVLELSEEDLEPRIHYVAPEYPAMARDGKVEGTVTLRAEIATDGTIIGL